MSDQRWGSAIEVPSDAAIDSFAQKILEKHSTSSPDESLGSYVTSLLRIADLDSTTKVENISDVEGLVELLQEHCGVSSEAEAMKVLQMIVTLMVEKRMPDGIPSASPLFLPQENDPPPPLDIDEERQFRADSSSMPKSLLSPERADSLLPHDLLDEYDDVPQCTAVVQTQIQSSDTPAVGSEDTETPRSTSGDAAIPPLSAAGSGTAKPNQLSSESQLSDEATAPLSGESSPDNQVMGGHVGETGFPAPYPNPYHFEAAKNMLLAMNADLSVEAAYAAAEVAKADVHVAQYVLHAASTAPPICRHLLGSGCYRRDCTFSHNVQNHTCLFWMRGRCGKGQSCQFLHDFSPVHLPPQQEQQQPTSMEDVFPSLPVASGHVVPSVEGSFANIASMGYSAKASFSDNQTSSSALPRRPKASLIPTKQIPMELWTMHENRDSSTFHIVDPLERYYHVMASTKRSTGRRAEGDNLLVEGIVDLHYQSLKTFEVVLLSVLPEMMQTHDSVWIVTGTGHHVGSRTHQKGGGTLESAVLEWLIEQLHNGSAPYCKIHRGKDRNGQGGALLVSK